METITKEYNVYEFKELKPEVKEQVLDKLREQELNSDFWYEMELECIAEDLKDKYGIEVKPREIYFDIYRNWAALDKNADIIDEEKFLRHFVENKRLLAQAISNPDWRMDNIRLNINTTHNGEKNVIDVLHNGNNYEDGDERWEEDTCKEIFEEELGINLDDCIEKINKWMLERLIEQQDYVGSEEYLVNEIEARELKFLENGEVFY